jgi:hypothetical protein
MNLQEIAAAITTKTTQEEVEAMLAANGFCRPEVGVFFCDNAESVLKRDEVQTALLLAHESLYTELR